MADINAAAGGTLNQDPFSVNLSDGVGQGQEPDISPTAPDDDLNKDADKLELLNDTDHSTMPNETNLIQSMQETLAANDSGDHEFRGDLQSFLTVDFLSNEEELQQQQALDIQAGLESMDFLARYKGKFNAIGIKQSDVVAIESVYPGLLTQGIGTTYTIESSDTNLEFALAKVSERVTLNGKELLAKLKPSK